MQELKNSFVSLTAAQNMLRLLGQNGIRAAIRRAGNTSGCRYVVQVEAKNLSRANALAEKAALAGAKQ